MIKTIYTCDVCKRTSQIEDHFSPINYRHFGVFSKEFGRHEINLLCINCACLLGRKIDELITCLVNSSGQNINLNWSFTR